MSTIVHKLTVDVLRGVDQKNTKWGQWASIYTGKTDLFAFWDTDSSVQLGRTDLRELVKRKDSGVGKGERPGQLPSSDFSELTFTDTGKCDALVFDPDQAAVLKIIRTSSTGGLKTTEGIRVIGDQRQEFEIESPVAPKAIVGVDVEGVEVLFETNTFLLQNINESFQEKFQVAETFGEPVLFLFDKRQQIFQYGGVLLDTQNWQWKEKFLDNYERHLRGTRAIKSNAIAILITNTAIVRGYILNTGIVQNDQTRGYVGFNFSMFVVDRIPLDEIERSPQDQLAAEEEEQEPQVVFLRINDQATRPGVPIKTLELSNGKVEIDHISPGTGWGSQDFQFASAFRATGKVNGEDPVVLEFPGLGLVNPPDIPFTDPSKVPSKHLTEIVEAEVGAVELKEREDLGVEPVPTVFAVTASLKFLKPVLEAGDPLSDNIMFHVVSPGAGLPGHNLSQIIKMKALFDAGKLKTDFALNASTNFQDIHEVVAFRTFQETNGQLPYRSVSGQTALGAPEGLAFEIQVSPPLLASVFKPGGGGFTTNDVIRMKLFERDVFVPEDPPDVQFSPALYHIVKTPAGSVFARRVGNGDGSRRNIGQFHVLTDPSGSFQTELQGNFDAGDNIFVTLPYDVIDEGEESRIPTAKVKVKQILSETELKLGLLTRAVKNKIGVTRQGIAEMDLVKYKVIVEGSEGFKIDESEIRKRVLNPPTGAFDNVNTADPLFAKLVQPQGAFQLKENTHFTKK